MLAYLHTHTEYSALDGMSHPIDILERAKEFGAQAVSVNDHVTVAGHIAFLQAAKKVGVKPILGYEAYEWNDKYHKNRLKRWHTNMWARTDEGMHNLWKIASLAYHDSGEGHWKPDSYEHHFSENGKGVIASSACLAGAMSYFAKQNDVESAEWYSKRMLDYFDDFYIEIHTNREDGQQEVNRWLMDFAKSHNIKTIYAIDSHYVLPEDAVTHETLLGAQTHSSCDDPNRFRMRRDYYIQPEGDIRSRLSYLGDEDVNRCFDGVKSLVNSIDTDYPIDVKNKIPSFGVENPDSLLKKLCLGGLVKKVMCGAIKEDGTYQIPKGAKEKAKPYVDRLIKEEFPVIIDNGLSDYFLITADYVKWAKQKMLVGAGRGSGAGSLVNYLLDITTIDPLQFDLPFARFLNEGRVKSYFELELEDGTKEKISEKEYSESNISDEFKGKKIASIEFHSGSLPDIDVDFPDTAKASVGDYLADKYGQDRVARIGNVQTMGAKMALKKCATFWKVPFSEANTMSKLLGSVPDIALVDEGKMSWDEAIESASQETKKQLDNWISKYENVFRDAKRMTGLVASYGKHASGYVISPFPTYNILPTRKVHEGKVESVVTQWDGVTLEALGFLKADILGLRTLTTLEEAMRLVKDRKGESIDFYSLKEDKSDGLWEMLSKGDTLGCFQVETDGITGVIKSMKPTCIEDIAIAIALYRPGVIDAGMLGVYLNRRSGIEKVELLHPDLESILGSTLGVIVFQEQVMNICVKLAGYSMVEADNMRKIMGKKMSDLLSFEEKRFKERAIKNGYEESMLNELWRQMAASGRYSFNKGHAVSYATVSYWTAWMKYHYRVEFMCALMTTNIGKVPEYINAAKRMGIDVCSPDINNSGEGFTVDGENSILFGLSAIKGVAESACKAIIEARPFMSFEDFCERTSKRCNKANRRDLVKCGAFRSVTDKPIVEMLDILGYPHVKTEWDDDDTANAETELMGLCVSVDKFAEPIDALGDMMMQVSDAQRRLDAKYGANLLILAEIASVRSHVAKNGKEMAFTSLKTHDSEKIDVTMFGGCGEAVLSMVCGDVILVQVEKQLYNQNSSWVAKKIQKFER